jgi:putative C-S lyase
MYEAFGETPTGVIPLSVADMEFLAAPCLREGLLEYVRSLVFGYPAVDDAYFDAVINWMGARHGWRIEREWIVPNSGVVSAFFNAVKTLAKEGEAVIIMPPVYKPFRMAMELTGRVTLENQLILNGDGRYEIDFDDLEIKARDPRAKALLFCSPANPVGRVWSVTELEHVANICLRHNLYIISDEIHFDIIMPGFHHHVFSALSEDIARRTITCTAPSKTFNIPGLKASNTIIPNPELRKRFEHTLYRNGDPGLNIIAYKAVEIAYTQGVPWLEEALLVLDGNRRFAEDVIGGIRGIRAMPLEGTYLQWWDCRGLGLDDEALEGFMRKEALLLLNSGPWFGSGGSGFMRINLACPRSALAVALERLGKAVALRFSR